MRSLALLIVLPLLVTGAARAGVSAYPASYHGHGDRYYENLRAAKIAWLSANAASLAADLAAVQSHRAKTRSAADLARLKQQTAQISAELAVMRGPRNMRQQVMLKKNVEAWIGAARRGGNGEVALRLMYDLQGSGL